MNELRNFLVPCIRRKKKKSVAGWLLSLVASCPRNSNTAAADNINFGTQATHLRNDESKPKTYTGDTYSVGNISTSKVNVQVAIGHPYNKTNLTKTLLIG